jgi:hypothetical protein
MAPGAITGSWPERGTPLRDGVREWRRRAIATEESLTVLAETLRSAQGDIRVANTAYIFSINLV